MVPTWGARREHRVPLPIILWYVTDFGGCPLADTAGGFFVDSWRPICYDLRSDLLRNESGTSQSGDLI